jgi:8-oxo-dGTP pyrophosphatase MutT (NUDIX family)
MHHHRKLNKILQPGGHVEPDENPWQAISHELIEETGYQMDQLQVLQPSVRLDRATGVVMHPVPIYTLTHDFNNSPEHKHTDLGFAFITGQEPSGAPDQEESQEIYWLSVSEIAELDAERIWANVREIGLFVLANFDKWQAVSTASFRA